MKEMTLKNKASSEAGTFDEQELKSEELVADPCKPHAAPASRASSDSSPSSGEDEEEGEPAEDWTPRHRHTLTYLDHLKAVRATRPVNNVMPPFE